MLTSERLPRSWSTSATSSVSTTSWLDPLCSSTTTSSLSRAATDPTNLQYDCVLLFCKINVKCDFMTYNKLSPSLCAYFRIILIDKRILYTWTWKEWVFISFLFFSFQDKTPTEPNPEVCPCVNQGCYN